MARPTLEPDEFTEVFARHGRTLWVLAAAWVGRSEASDLVQETARVGWERRGQFATGSDMRAWLAQIARHVGANWRRRQRPVPTSPEELPEVAAPKPVLAMATFDADGLGLPDELAAGLAGLTEIARACLLLHVVMGHSFAEVATMLDIAENTAASHTRRARMALRETLAARPIREAR